MYQVPVDTNDSGVSAIVIRGRKDKLLPPSEAYFETLHAGVRAWTEHLLRVAETKGLAPYNTSATGFYDEAEWYQQWNPQSYETNQDHKLYLYTKKNGKLNRVIHISVYRMPSGRYEVTAHLS